MVDGIGRGGPRVDLQNQVNQLQQQQPVEQVSAQRIEAFDQNDSLVKGGDNQLAGSVSAQSALPQEQQASINNLMSTMSPEAQEKFLTAGLNMAKGLVSAQGSMNSEAEMLTILNQGMNDIAGTTNPSDAASLAQNSMLGAYAGVQNELGDFASKVQNTNDSKQVMREEMAMLEDEMLDWPDDGSTREITYRELQQNPDGTYSVVEKTKTMTKAEAQALHDKMGTQLDTLSEVGQMDMLKLQDAMNQQAQLMQMMSNITKMMHDTAMALIRNMK